MAQIALHPWLHVPEARTGTYNGVETALSFGDSTAELAALRTGCGVFALAWRGRINVSGKDRVRWLHNMVTNNVRDLPANRGNYNFVLNAQGRILGDMYIYNRGESFSLETDASQIEALVHAMRRFIIMDKVELMPVGADSVSVGICGPKAESALLDAGVNASGMQPLEVRDVGFDDIAATLVHGPEQKPGWFEFWLDPNKAQELWNLLVKAGAKPVGAEALEKWRVLQGIPNYGQDIRDRDLPQETEQTQALNFTKGCYIGQEIVERIRSRGQVHRKFAGFIFGDRMPALGKYESEGRALAEITSIARVPTSQGPKNIGLGYVRREAIAAGPKIALHGIEATVVDLPFEIES
ncbi:MAG TPA: folate-binding protein [Candidatus Angelobacter sp.]|jgi:aminomethyltransferase|nr:folate-binding protein [Candidatus Angelobacter sp.]